MKVMILVKATQDSENGVPPSPELMQTMGAFNDELIAAGIMKDGEGLKPSSAGARVRFSGADRVVTDGPFAETKELIAGYWIWEVQSLDEAKEWVKRCPNPMIGDSDIEIRPLYEPADYAEWDPTGELEKQDQTQRNAVAGQGSSLRTYLFFGGRCEEALDFYREHLGAQVEFLMRFNESPDPLPEGMLKSGFEAKIMHAEFKVGDVRLMASDGCDEASSFSGFRLALSAKEVADAERLFNALASGGTIEMPMTKTFWSPSYGQVTDRFGVPWMVMADGPEVQ